MRYNRKIALLILTCINSGKDVAAAEWALNGSLGQQLQYNDNIALSTTQKDSVVGYLLTPSLQASRKTGALDIAVNGLGDIRRYDNSSWDCDSYNLGTNNGYRLKRNIFSLTGGYAASCSYAQQIKETGLLVPSSQSITYRISPSWTWQWTPKDQLTLGASYANTSFSNSLGNISANTGNNPLSFTGNETYSVNLGGSHVWSRNLSLNGKLNFSDVQYSGSNTSTQYLFGFQLGANYVINRYWTVSADGGPIWVDSQGAASGQNSSLSLGSSANINLSYTEQLSKFSTGFSNTVSPSAIGQTLQSQSVFANYSYPLTRHLSLDLTANLSHSQSIGSQATDTQTGQFDRTYFTAGTGITWEFAKYWQLKGSYAYRRQNIQQDNNVQNFNTGTSDSNLLMLSLNYSWDGIRISR